MEDQFISVRETAQIMEISEKKVMDLITDGKLQAYRIADKFLRLKKNEVIELRNSLEVKREAEEYPYSPAERIKDFFYYNDFYLVSCVIISVLLFIIFYL